MVKKRYEKKEDSRYSIFKQSSESVRGGVIIGLGSRLQVFQNRDIRNITGHDEIDLELPGKQPCAYSKHPEAKKLRASKAASHIPDWQARAQEMEQAASPAPPNPKRTHSKKSVSKTGQTKPGSEVKQEPPAPAKAPPKAAVSQFIEPVPKLGPAPVSPERPPVSAPVKRSAQVVTATKDNILSKPKEE